MQKSKNDIWVGLFVVLGLASLLFLALQAANLLNLNLQPTYQVVAKFDNIGGLKPKAAVRSAGVLVGRVETISLDPQSYQARVTISMQEQFSFPKDSSLKILTSGLLGEQYIGVEPGSDEAAWKQGAVISQTQSAVVLENLIGQFMFSKAQEGSKAPETTGTGSQ